VGPARAEFGCGLEAVHLGHPDVQKHDVVSASRRLFDRLAAVRHGFGRMAQEAEDSPDRRADHLVVIGHQDPQRGGHRRQWGWRG
jgi:hypothetical protein